MRALLSKTVILALFFISIAQAATTLPVTIEDGGKKFIGDLFLPSKATRRKLPLVIVIHEWWGKNEYPRMRGGMIADELGYAALVVDLYGEGKTVDNPKDAQELATPFYKDPSIAVARLEKFIAKAPVVAKAANIELSDKKSAAIGYCFGGSQALALGRSGKISNVVAFHAGLASTLKTHPGHKWHVLVLHGAADPFVKPEEVDAFKKEMKDAKVDLKFVAYTGAVHAFSNPKSTETGKQFGIPVAYDQKADEGSWKEMKKFLRSRF